MLHSRFFLLFGDEDSDNGGGRHDWDGSMKVCVCVYGIYISVVILESVFKYYR